MNKEFALYLIIDVVSSILVYKAFRIFFKGKEKYSNTIIVISFSVYHILIALTHFVLEIPNVVLVVNLASFFFLSNLFEATFKKKFFFSILLYSILMIIESISVLICFYITREHNDILGYAASQVMIIISLGVFNQRNAFTEEVVIPHIQLASVIFFPLGGLVIFVFVDKYTPEVISLFALIILLVFDILIMYIFEVMNKEYFLKLSRELELQEKKSESKIYYREKHYYENQLKIINEAQDQIRTLKHDLKTHQFVLKKLLENEKVEESLKYLEQIYNSVDPNYLHYIDTENIHIDSILNYKITFAASKNIKVNCKVQIPRHLNVDSFDISVILGNLLDNAIEAEELRKEESKVIDLVMKYDRGCFNLRIKNKYAHTLNTKNGDFVTHKNDSENHGLGLKSVQRSVDKYNGSLDFDIDEDAFVVKVFLYL